MGEAARFFFGADNRTHIALQSALLDDRKLCLQYPSAHHGFAKNDYQSFS
ncbi:MAG: hypothetical protein IJD91_00875 [Clostridia bacterium]|nr:hypothetical protein [Clostridia bacterium]